MTVRPVVKRTARAVLLDGDDLILIKRTKPGVDPYWVTPGGGVEPSDTTVVDALHREVYEELGAKVTDVVPCFVDTVEHIGEDGGATGVKVQHFFVCRLESMDPALRHGPEIDEPTGEYEIVRVPFTRVASPPSTSSRSRCGTTWTATSRACAPCTPLTWADREPCRRCDVSRETPGRFSSGANLTSSPPPGWARRWPKPRTSPPKRVDAGGAHRTA